MSKKTAYFILFLINLFTACKKDVALTKDGEYPIVHQYDAFYKDGLLDSLIHIYGSDGEFSRIQSIKRNDSFYTIAIWNGSAPSETLKYYLQGSRVVTVWYQNHDSTISYLKHKYTYEDNSLDSSYNYVHTNDGIIILQHKSHYQYDESQHCLTITNSDIYSTPPSIDYQEHRFFKKPLTLFTPMDLFPFSATQPFKFEHIKIVPRYLGAGRPTLLNIQQDYEYTQNQLRIWHYTTNYYGAANPIIDTTQTIIRYHGT